MDTTGWKKKLKASPRPPPRRVTETLRQRIDRRYPRSQPDAPRPRHYAGGIHHAQTQQEPPPKDPEAPAPGAQTGGGWEGVGDKPVSPGAVQKGTLIEALRILVGVRTGGCGGDVAVWAGRFNITHRSTLHNGEYSGLIKPAWSNSARTTRAPSFAPLPAGGTLGRVARRKGEREGTARRQLPSV